jgi:hypothetical protein
VQTSDHIHAAAAKLTDVLAPASSPAHPISSWHYATESWSGGGVLLGLAIVALLLILVAAVVRRA